MSKAVPTRERLLDAATEVFAESGYRNARVREICRRAGANLAAVSYSFGGKKALYRASVRHAFFALPDQDVLGRAAPDTRPPEDRLRSFIRTFLRQVLSEDRHGLFAKLIAREMVDPTDALEEIMEEGFQPPVENLIAIVREILPPRTSRQHAIRCAGSVLGQCLYYHFARHVILGMRLERSLSEAAVSRLADHIVQFSVRAMREP